MKITTLKFLTTLSLIWHSPIAAQDISLEDQLKQIPGFNDEKPTVPEKAIFSVRSDGGDSSLGPLAPQIQARSSIEGDSIKVTVGTSVAEWENFGETNYSVSLTAPFNKKKDEGNFLTEAGLPGTLSLEFAFSTSILDLPKAVVEAAHRADLVERSIPIYLKCKSVNAADTSKCQGVDIHELAKTYGTTEQQEKLNKLSKQLEDQLLSKPYLGVQLNGSVGRDSYKYRDLSNFAELKPKKTLYSLGASLAYLPSLGSPIGFFIGGEYKRNFKLPDTEIRCPIPVAGSTSVTCSESAFGAPKKDINATLFGAVRLNGELLKGFPLSGEMKVAYDLNDNDWGVSMPIYFIRNKDGKLNGGVKLGYNGDKKDFVLGFFVGTTFGFLSR